MVYEEAEQTQADVIHAEGYFKIVNETETEEDFHLNVQFDTYQQGESVEYITRESDNLKERIIGLFRVHENSTSHNYDTQSIKEYIKKYVKVLVEGTKALDKFINEREFFEKIHIILGN